MFILIELKYGFMISEIHGHLIIQGHLTGTILSVNFEKQYIVMNFTIKINNYKLLQYEEEK